jgi:hypothetical protein
MTRPYPQAHRATAHAGLVLVALASLVAVRPLAGQSTEPAKWYDRIQFNGDLRVRYDGIYQDLEQDGDLRTRLRFRLRFGVTAPITTNLTAGFRLATNEGGDPTSGNVTLGSSLTSKEIAVDRAFITWAPGKVFSITGGKFASPLFRPAAVIRSEMIFDEDYAPEGLHETFKLVSRKEGLVRGFTVHLAQWYIQEYSKANDVFMLGGQGVLDLKPGERSSLTVAGGYYNYVRGKQLAQSRNSNSQIKVTNSVILRDGTLLEGGQLLKPDPDNPFDRYLYNFEMLNGSVAWQRDRTVGKAALQLYADLVHNAGAAEDRFAYYAGIGLDSRSTPGWNFSATYTHVEQEAVLSTYSYSDLGLGGSNQKGPILQVQYRPARNVTLSARHHIVTPIKVVASDKVLQRLQVDAAVSF